MPTAPITPYSTDLGDRNPLEALRETSERIRALTWGWSVSQFERRYAEGKWTARQILVHLAQAELALTTRVRFAASQEGYTAQPFNQDAWLALDDHADAATAVDAYLALRRFNLAMFKGMTPKQRKAAFTHPEYGTLTPEWVAAQLAGHDIHHLKQLKQIR